MAPTNPFRWLFPISGSFPHIHAPMSDLAVPLGYGLYRSPGFSHSLALYPENSIHIHLPRLSTCFFNLGRSMAPPRLPLCELLFENSFRAVAGKILSLSHFLFVMDHSFLLSNVQSHESHGFIFCIFFFDHFRLDKSGSCYFIFGKSESF
jgi:hypothetical protein